MMNGRAVGPCGCVIDGVECEQPIQALNGLCSGKERRQRLCNIVKQIFRWFLCHSEVATVRVYQPGLDKHLSVQFVITHFILRAMSMLYLTTLLCIVKYYLAIDGAFRVVLEKPGDDCARFLPSVQPIVNPLFLGRTDKPHNTYLVRSLLDR